MRGDVGHLAYEGEPMSGRAKAVAAAFRLFAFIGGIVLKMGTLHEHALA